MIKLVVGVEDLDHLLEIQAQSHVEYEGKQAFGVRTRFRPKRFEELMAGGSLYRVIKNRIQCRQRILGFETIETAEKGSQCLIMVDSSIIQTIYKPKRPFQGWRYLEPSAVPKDRGVYLGNGERTEIPVDMEDELREAGLL